MVIFVSESQSQELFGNILRLFVASGFLDRFTELKHLTGSRLQEVFSSVQTTCGIELRIFQRGQKITLSNYKSYSARGMETDTKTKDSCNGTDTSHLWQPLRGFVTARTSLLLQCLPPSLLPVWRVLLPCLSCNMYSHTGVRVVARWSPSLCWRNHSTWWVSPRRFCYRVLTVTPQARRPLWCGSCLKHSWPLTSEFCM